MKFPFRGQSSGNERRPGRGKVVRSFESEGLDVAAAGDAFDEAGEHAPRAALDDLPGHARRFARWKAASAAAGAQRKDRAAAGAQKKPDRFRRITPLRRGRPPGGRLTRYDPTATHPRKIREVDEILAHAHALAVYALEASDTS